MSTTLATGHRINLEKTAPGLKRVRIGLGWKVNAADGQPFEIVEPSPEFTEGLALMGATDLCPFSTVQD